MQIRCCILRICEGGRHPPMQNPLRRRLPRRVPRNDKAHPNLQLEERRGLQLGERRGLQPGGAACSLEDGQKLLQAVRVVDGAAPINVRTTE
jgi:hypothetical protein